MTLPTALIIEDDPVLNQVFSLALRGLFEIEVITDGQVALTRLAEFIPSLVVLDLHLPHVNGMNILNHIRDHPRLAQMRVILATADARQAEHCQDLADIVLLKPVNPVQLRELATRLCSV